jgi:hypothetical protein
MRICTAVRHRIKRQLATSSRHGTVTWVPPRARTPRFTPLEATDADFNIHGSEHGWHAGTGDYGATVDALLCGGGEKPAGHAGSQAVRDGWRRCLDILAFS